MEGIISNTPVQSSLSSDRFSLSEYPPGKCFIPQSLHVSIFFYQDVMDLDGPTEFQGPSENQDLSETLPNQGFSETLTNQNLSETILNHNPPSNFPLPLPCA